jgi:hypothetical protein
MLKRIPKMLLLVALLTKRPGFEGLKNVQVLSLGRQTTSAASRMSLRPKNFPVRQNQLPRDLLLVVALFGPRLSVMRGKRDELNMFVTEPPRRDSRNISRGFALSEASAMS